MNVSARTLQDIHKSARSLMERLDSCLNDPDGTVAEYTTQKVCPLVSLMIDELVAARPENPTLFLGFWLLEKCGAAKALAELGSPASPQWNAKSGPVGGIAGALLGAARTAGNSKANDSTQVRDIKAPLRSSMKARASSSDISGGPKKSCLRPGSAKDRRSTSSDMCDATPKRPQSAKTPRQAVLSPPESPPPQDEQPPPQDKEDKEDEVKKEPEKALDLGLKCANGHGLVEGPCAYEASCDNCGKDIDIGERAWLCAECSYDRCTECSDRTQASPVAAKQEAPSEEPAKEDANSAAKSKLKRKVSLFAGVGDTKTIGRKSPGGDEDSDDNEYESENKMMAQLRGGDGTACAQKKEPPRMQRRFSMVIASSQIEMVSEADGLELLKKVPMFTHYNDEELKMILAVAACHRYQPDENIVNFGCTSDRVHIIIDGAGKCSVPRPVGKVQYGDFFGDEALRLAGETSPCTVEAQGGPLTTLSVPANRFRSLDLKHCHLERTKAKQRAQENRTVRGGGAHKDIVDNANISKDSGRAIIQDYQQTNADRALIRSAVRNNKVLADVLQLTDDQCELICNSVHLIALKNTECLMRKGDPGKALYIVQDGLLDVCVKEYNEDGEGEFKARLGDAFGEMALLYDTPRAATITAIRDCTLWVLPRSMFREVTRLNYSARIAQYSELLQNVPCLQESLAECDAEMIAGVLEEIKVDKGDDICVEGEDEGLLFIMFDGECTASKEDHPDDTRVMKKGDWIGEHQLQHSETAEETVTVDSEFAVALVLDMSSLNMVTKAGQALKKWGENADFDLREKGDFADTFAHRRISRSANRRSVKRRSMVDGGERSSRAASVRLSEIEMKEDLEAAYDIKTMNNIGVLGEGGFGSVVLLEDKKGERYALKGLLKTQIISDSMSSAVANERNILMLLDSDFVVKCFASFIDAKCVYFLLEPVFGGELFDVFMDLNLFGSKDHARFYTACITLGLQHMHRNRVVYRDLKLENCLLDDKGYVKLTDVGIAKIVLGKTYTICGTADYFAPETLRQAGHNRGVDWWACGVLLFIMCAGQSPFDAPEVTQIYKNIIKGFSKVKFPKDFTSDLIEVVKALCRKKPEDRVTMQKGGVDNLMALPFFAELDWSGLSSRTADAPMIPEPPDLSKLAAKKLTRDISMDGEVEDWDGSTEWAGGPSKR